MQWIERYILSTTLAQSRGVAGAKMPYILPNGDILPNADEILKATTPVWQQKQLNNWEKENSGVAANVRERRNYVHPIAANYSLQEFPFA